jgi:hypothetical protein
MRTRTGTAIAALAAAIAAMAGIASAIGVFARGTGTYQTVTSVRGETYDMATSGIYMYNAQRVVAEGVGWDVFTLFAAVPAMVLAAVLVARGSFRGRLVAAGMFGYFLYQYLGYSVTWAFGPLFLLFVAVYAASLVGIGLVAADLAASSAGRFGSGFPRRAWPLLLVAMSLLLTVMWVGRVFGALTDGIDGVLLGETTMTVQALDLGLVVPVSIAIAVMTWRGHEPAMVAGAAFTVTFVALAAAITSMLVSAWFVDGVVEVGPIAIFALAAAAGAWQSVRIFRSIAPTVARPPIRASSTAPA